MDDSIKKMIEKRRVAFEKNPLDEKIHLNIDLNKLKSNNLTTAMTDSENDKPTLITNDKRMFERHLRFFREQDKHKNLSVIDHLFTERAFLINSNAKDFEEDSKVREVYSNFKSEYIPDSELENKLFEGKEEGEDFDFDLDLDSELELIELEDLFGYGISEAKSRESLDNALKATESIKNFFSNSSYLDKDRLNYFLNRSRSLFLECDFNELKDEEKNDLLKFFIKHYHNVSENSVIDKETTEEKIVSNYKENKMVSIEEVVQIAVELVKESETISQFITEESSFQYFRFVFKDIIKTKMYRTELDSISIEDTYIALFYDLIDTQEKREVYNKNRKEIFFAISKIILSFNKSEVKESAQRLIRQIPSFEGLSIDCLIAYKNKEEHYRFFALDENDDCVEIFNQEVIKGIVECCGAF